MTFKDIEESVDLGSPIELYKFTMGATEWRFTGGDIEATIAEPNPGPGPPTIDYEYVFAGPISRTAMDFSQEDTAGAIVIRVPRTNPVALLGVAYAPPTAVGVTIRSYHRSDGDLLLMTPPEVIIEFVGEITGWSFEGSQVALTCAPISQGLGRLIPMLRYQSQCNWALFSPGCTLDPDDFKVTATLDTVDGVTLTDTTFAGKPDGWFTNGWVQRSNGERRFIVNHAGDTLTLMNRFPTDLVAGETVDAFAGCQRTEAECATKFNNLANHLGFARIPSRNPHGGGSIA